MTTIYCNLSSIVSHCIRDKICRICNVKFIENVYITVIADPIDAVNGYWTLPLAEAFSDCGQEVKIYYLQWEHGQGIAESVVFEHLGTQIHDGYMKPHRQNRYPAPKGRQQNNACQTHLHLSRWLQDLFLWCHGTALFHWWMQILIEREHLRV